MPSPAIGNVCRTAALRTVRPHVVGVGGSAGFSTLRCLDAKNTLKRRFSICRIADLQSAERRIGTRHRSSPTPRRVQLCDTAQRGPAATKSVPFLYAFGCWLRLGRAALYGSGRLLRPGQIEDWERGLHFGRKSSCKQIYLKTSFPKALWTSLVL